MKNTIEIEEVECGDSVCLRCNKTIMTVTDFDIKESTLTVAWLDDNCCLQEATFSSDCFEEA